MFIGLTNNSVPFVWLLYYRMILLFDNCVSVRDIWDTILFLFIFKYSPFSKAEREEMGVEM